MLDCTIIYIYTYILLVIEYNGYISREKTQTDTKESFRSLLSFLLEWTADTTATNSGTCVCVYSQLLSPLWTVLAPRVSCFVPSDNEWYCKWCNLRCNIEYHDVLYCQNVTRFQGTCKCNLVQAHKSSMTLPASFWRNSQVNQHYAWITYSDFHQNRIINVEITERNSLKTLSKIWLQLHPYSSWKSQPFNVITPRHSVPKFIHFYQDVWKLQGFNSFMPLSTV